MRAYNILFVLTELFVGGAQRQLYRIIANLDREKFNPVICCLKKEGILAEDFRRLGIRVTAINSRNKRDLRVIPRLLNILRKEEIHIIYTIGAGDSMFWGRLCGVILNTPVRISSVHRIGYPLHEKTIEFLNKLLVPFTDRIIAVAEAQRKYLVEKEGISEDKLEVIYNTIDIDRYRIDSQSKLDKGLLGIPEDDKIVGIIASLRPDKRHDIFINAAADVLDVFPHTSFLIVGDGSEKANIESLIDRYDIGAKVHMVGNRDDIPEILSLLDISVLSSEHEVFPNTILESFAMGKPVVATAVGGVPEIVYDGYNGFLVPPYDHIALSNAIKRILHSPTLGQRMGEEGRRIVAERFNIESLIKRREALFSSLIENSNRRR